MLFSRVGKPFIGYSDTFSFNHPDGKCPTCDGLGKVTEIHLHQLVDFNKSLNEDPIDFPTFHKGKWRWKRYANSGLFDLDEKKLKTTHQKNKTYYSMRHDNKSKMRQLNGHILLYMRELYRVYKEVLFTRMKVVDTKNNWTVL